MSAQVTIVDYGLGNLFSVRRAFEVSGAKEILVTGNSSEVARAERLVLPGVGAFADGMRGLEKLDLIHSILEFARKERPFLGICLGMQMMMEVGKEFGEHWGLGLISGEVLAIPRLSADGKPMKVPHIGWSELSKAEYGDWDNTLFKNTPHRASVYFVHSFAAHPKRGQDVLATTDFGGNSLVAAIASGSLMGCQFHPERSGPVGLQMIESFLTL